MGNNPIPSKQTYGEAKTVSGQVIKFTCHPDEIEKIRKLLETSVYEVFMPTTSSVVKHGSHGEYSRYEIQQLKYLAGQNGFIEILKIDNPPEERCGFIINEYTTRWGGVFSEWKSLEDAKKAFSKFGGELNTEKYFSESPGFKRLVSYGPLTPWFYAIGDELLVGDFAVANGFEDDTFYRLGKKFLVKEESGASKVKICLCLGTRFVRRECDDPPYHEVAYRIVYFHDGTVWDERNFGSTPQPLSEEEYLKMLKS